MISFKEDFWHVFHSQARTSAWVWARNLMFEQMVVEIPKRSARSSLSIPKRSRMRVSKNSTFGVNFF